MWDLWWAKWHWDIFSPSPPFSPVSITPPLLHIHPCIIWGMDIGPVSQRDSLTPAQRHAEERSDIGFLAWELFGVLGYT
jgi:hypothetical protein